MLRNLKKELILIAFGVTLFVLLTNFRTVIGFADSLIHICMPVVLGFIIAFILNVPMSGVEKLTVRITRGKVTNLKPNLRRLLYLMLTIAIAAVVLTVIIVMIIPDLAASAKSLYFMIMAELPEIIDFLKSYGINAQWITGFLENFDIENFVSSTVTFASSAVSGIVEFSIGLIIALYALMSKEDLGYQTNRLIKAFMKDVWATKVRNIAILTSRTYSKFLSGQCLEACILGGLIFITLNIAGVPYADLIGVMTIVCAFVPYIGAFLSFTVGALLVAIVAPQKLIMYAAICLIVQFIEGHFIYPYVVGNSVGMKPLWTLIAVIIGGKLMGLFGMIFFIPLMSVVVTLFKDYTDRVLNRKENFNRSLSLRGKPLDD
ncbi:MAG: AI-2E family transporter [Firmicutes bacterium]|nr:AI-2E family transporter [Bacillota bacterium]